MGLCGGARADGPGASPVRTVLQSFFPQSQRVSPRSIDLTAAQKQRLESKLGVALGKDHWVVFVARTGERIDGYAIVDDEMGQHQPITFATKLSPRGAVERLEIVVYREPRGDEVRDPRFRRQFEGKTAQDPIRLGRDIDAVSGATISSGSMAVGVRRAVALLEELVLAPAAQAASRS